MSVNKFAPEQYAAAGFHIHPGLEERGALRTTNWAAFKALSNPERDELFAYEQGKRNAEELIRRNAKSNASDEFA